LQWDGLGTAIGLNDEIKQDYSYQYDIAGNIVSIEEQVKNCGIRNPDPDRLLRAFEYDPIYRLTRASGRAAANASAAPPYADPRLSGFHPAGNPAFTQDNGPDLTEDYTQDYQYDPAGNMLAMGHSQGSVRWVRQYANAAGSNRLASITVGSDAFTCDYDANGNLSRQALNHLHDWDHADRMIGYRNQNGSATSVEARYLYGADGMRVKKWVRRGGSANGEESTTYINGMFEHHRWSDSGATRANNHLHVMDNQSRVAMQRIGPANQEEAAPEVQYHLGDHLGSSSLVIGGVDARGDSFLNREEYTPYGESSFGSFGRKRYLFSSKERDGESSLSYFGARYLAPWMARWVNCDPVGPIDGLNVYNYTKSNPVGFHDASGMQASDPPATAKEPPGLAIELDPNDVRLRFGKGLSPTADHLYEKTKSLGIKFVIDPELDRRGNRGGYVAETNTISINPSSFRSITDLREIVVHELFHADSHRAYIENGLSEKEIQIKKIEHALSFASQEDFFNAVLEEERKAEEVALRASVEWAGISASHQDKIIKELTNEFIVETRDAYKEDAYRFYRFWRIREIEKEAKDSLLRDPPSIRQYEDLVL
jgi:RHS repeat-associated protein